eukprot:Sspe_Gene.100073::Locus_74674_Transcript_1_1_Confidence_1.000_Length_688::g.100073::m.100073
MAIRVRLEYLKAFAVLVILLCAIAQVVAIHRSKEDTWFTECKECKRHGGAEDCEECCIGCTMRERMLFYTKRGYALLFCCLALAVETTFEWVKRAFRMLTHFMGRGFLQAFVGFLTVDAMENPTATTEGSSSYKYGTVVGYMMMAT